MAYISNAHKPNQVFPVIKLFRIKCSEMENCTHYTWTHGNCQMRTGMVKKKDAMKLPSNESICGLIPVQWHGLSWAISCSFKGNHIAAVLGPGDICTTECDEQPGCSHFTWKNETCFLQEGEVSKADAFYSGDIMTVCGFCETCLGE